MRRSMTTSDDIDARSLCSFWSCGEGSVQALSQASHAFAVLARAAREPGVDPVFWFPEYFCGDALKPLQRLGAPIVCYPVDGRLRPDWAACESLSKDQRPGYFVLVHYFGRCNDLEGARAFCGRTGAKLVEDATHVLRPTGRIGRGGDFVCYSPRKFFDIPDGGLLVARGRADAVRIRNAIADFPAEAPATSRWHMKRLERGFRRGVLRRTKSGKPLVPLRVGTEMRSIEPFREILMSDYSRRHIVRALGTGDVERIVATARESERRLLARIGSESGAEPLPADEGATFWRTALMCRDEESAQRTLDRLRSAGIVALPWPSPLPTGLTVDGRDRARRISNRTIIASVP